MHIFTSRLFSDTGGSFGLPLEGRLTNTRSCPSAWPWRRERSQNLVASKELVSRHRDIVLRHIHSLGLRMNAKKSVLLPSQRTVFLGVRLDSIQMQARLAPARISNFTECLARFKLGRHVFLGTCRRLLGLMGCP